MWRGAGRWCRLRLVCDRRTSPASDRGWCWWLGRREVVASCSIGMQGWLAGLTIRRRDLPVGRHHAAARVGHRRSRLCRHLDGRCRATGLWRLPRRVRKKRIQLIDARQLSGIGRWGCAWLGRLLRHDVVSRQKWHGMRNRRLSWLGWRRWRFRPHGLLGDGEVGIVRIQPACEAK